MEYFVPLHRVFVGNDMGDFLPLHQVVLPLAFVLELLPEVRLSEQIHLGFDHLHDFGIAGLYDGVEVGKGEDTAEYLA